MRCSLFENLLSTFGRIALSSVQWRTVVGTQEWRYSAEMVLANFVIYFAKCLIAEKSA
jgi:hypothetical protein